MTTPNTSAPISIHSLPPVQRNAALAAMRRAARGRRVYQLDATRAGGRCVPISDVPDCSVSNLRIRAVAALMFRRIFGRAPSFQWHVEGRAAEAWDDHGNRLHVAQLNNQPAVGHAGV
jgi:hypothetical protein